MDRDTLVTTKRAWFATKVAFAGSQERRPAPAGKRTRQLMLVHLGAWNE